MGRDPQDPIIGRTLADFLVKEKLGEGGFGAVYKANQITLGREVVIKILHTKHRTNQEIIERFKREAHLASRLEHPYSAHIYAFGAETDGLLWIAMEYVAGTPLNEILKSQGALPLEKFVPLLDKICEVVHTAHESGIVHRDLKPANVMVISRAGRLLPKLLDFGIAKSFESVKPIANSSKTIINQHDNQTNITRNPVINALEEETTVKILPKEEQPSLDKANGPDATQSDPIINQQNIPGKYTVAINPEQTDGKQQEFLTEGIMGSPRYMSPEQWEGAAKADARSDIYALGVMVYECLTGRAPFLDTGHAALMRAHMLTAVPTLGGKFPSVLDTIISKAMAKEPIERYQTALELATAFRSAAGFSQEPQSLPQLNEELQDKLITTAPRPLAEAVANLASARNLYQSKDLIVRVLQILLRYLGLLSLVTYSRVRNEQRLSTIVSNLLNQLYKQGLSEEQWWELTYELAQPFAKQADIHPIPELVTLFFNSESEKVKQQVKELLDLKQTFALTGSVSEEQLLPEIEKFIGLMTKLLKNLTWLSSYSLVIAREQMVEKLMGAIRQSYSLEIKTKKLPIDQLALIDSTGNLVVILSPLIQFLSPSIGSANEIFFLERNGRRGAKLIAWPTGFEHENEKPWEWLRENFLAVAETGQITQLEEKSPYLGLTAFSPDDATMFFGRERETTSFLNRLRVQSLLAVIGPSGAGKSSFVQAGVIPGLPENWQSITLRPGSSPLATLSAKLSKLGIEFPDLKATLQKDIKALGKALRQFALKEKTSILLVIDQFEEIITLCLNKEEQRLYVEAIVLATGLEEDPIRVVLTMRDDFLVRVKELASLKDKLSQGLEILTTPAEAELLRILVEPAKQVGYEFEDPELPQEIVKAVKGQTSALPLLAFTAAKLWENRDRQFKQLRRKVYELMGGVGGALVGHAEEMMLQMTQTEQSLVREAFYHLVTSEGTRAVLTRPELVQLLGRAKDSETVIEKLISSRLLVTNEGEKGIDRIEIVHEALLSTWPRLVKWRQERAEGVRLRDQLRATARQWQERGCPKGLLWRDDALAEYKLWRERYQGKLTELEEDFGKASILDASRSQRIKRQLLVTAISILVIGSLVLFYQRQRTQEQLIETLDLYEEQGRQEMLKGNLEGASVYLSTAYANGANTLALRYMLTVALAKVENRLSITLNGHTNSVTNGAFSPDDKLVVTASTDKTARIWQVVDGKELFVLSGHKDTITFAQFSGDGKLLVTASLDKTACIWRASDGKLLTTLKGHTEALSKAIFSPDGKQVLTASYDGTAKIWDSATGKLIITLTGHQGAIYDVCFNKKGNLIATAGADKTAKVWNSMSGRLISTLAGHQGAVVKVAFSPMAKMLVTGSTDNMAMLWQTDEGKLVSTLVGHQGGITTVKFSPDGKNVLTTSVDKKACLWDVKTGKLINTLNGHKSDITDGNFSPDGKLIITSSSDNNVRVWEPSDGRFLVALAEHKGAIGSCVFSNNGESILSTSADNSAKIWQIGLEKRLPNEIAKIVEQKVNIHLEEGRLVTQSTNNAQQVKQQKNEKVLDNKISKNTYVEDLGNGIKIEMVSLTGGLFEMGSPKTQKDYLNDELLHKVKVSDFYIGKYEVTQAQWKAVAALPAINMLLIADPAKFKGDNYPVEQVTWEEAVEFCVRLSKATGKKYSLPTEAQWEYAAKAGSSNVYPNNLDESAWYNKNSEEKTHIIGQKKPNAWGLYDMFGNVFELCLDWYGDYPSGEMLTDPRGPDSGDERIARGGSFFMSPEDCRTVSRGNAEPTMRYNHVGFRLVMDIGQK